MTGGGSIDVRGRNRPRRRVDAATLVRSYRETGDAAARERLVELHLPLVRALARRYAHCGEQLDDLVQVGSIGLIAAIDRFDPERGSSFVSFAIPTITGEIKKHLRDRTAVVRVPRRLGELSISLRSPRARLSASLARTPTVAELARETGADESDVAEALRTEEARNLASLASIDGGTEGYAGFDASDARLLLAAGFRTLAARERTIVHLRFFAGLSQAEIAREVGLSQIQVSRLLRASLERMRCALDTADSRPRQPESLIDA